MRVWGADEWPGLRVEYVQSVPDSKREEVLEVVGLWVDVLDWRAAELRGLGDVPSDHLGELYSESFGDACMGLVEDLAEVLGFKVEELREGVR